VVLFAVAGGLLWHEFRQGRITAQDLFTLDANYPTLAPLAFIAGFAVCMIFQLPTLPLNIGAGALWGVWWGSVYSLTGGVLGSTATFIFARTVFGRPLAIRATGRLVTRVSENIDRKGWRVVAMMRLNPALPSGPVNFMLALSALPLTTFIWASALFNAPPCLAVSYFGHSAGRLLLEGGLAPWVQLAFAVLGVVLLLATGRMLFRSPPPPVESISAAQINRP